MAGTKLRVMSIMAHQDDFEFTAGGTFALLRRAYGDAVTMRILTTTRGAKGHHQLSPDETFVRRTAEATKSAAVIGATYECLTQLDGSHVPGQVFLERNVLGGLWNAIRAFEPDVIFCPPVVTDPLAGVHIDHVNTAHAVRLVAYQLCAPNAYPTMSGPKKLRFRIPLIVNVDDNYAREAKYHVRQDISAVYDTKVQMAKCHESQILEWLPWTAGATEPITFEAWRKTFDERHEKCNERYACNDGIPSEYFRITRWGRTPEEGELKRLFPKMIASHHDGPSSS